MPERRLRPFLPEDAEIILSWLENADEFLLWTAGCLSYPCHPHALIAYYAADPTAKPMTLVEDGIPVGHCLLRPNPGDDAYVRMIVVDGKRRGRGLGRALLEAVCRASAEADSTGLVLTVAEGNHAARRCYAAFGLTETGRTMIRSLAGVETTYREMRCDITRALPAILDLDGYWNATLAQNADAMAPYFTDDAVIDWPNTRERFNVTEYITANCTYPGDWTGEIISRRISHEEIITVTHVKDRDGASFHVTSFFTLRDGKITHLTEYWGDDGEPPAWRAALGLGRRTDEVTP